MHEQEADRVADQVLAHVAPVGFLRRQVETAAPKEAVEEDPQAGDEAGQEGENKVQMAGNESVRPKLARNAPPGKYHGAIPENGGKPFQTGVPGFMESISPASLGTPHNSPGRPLEIPTQAFMESRFQHDFSRVRVHTSPEAVESARAFDAFAYTMGNNIVFNQGRYAPQTNAGKRLLAHELTHVVQQTRIGSPLLQRQATSSGTATAELLSERPTDTDDAAIEAAKATLKTTYGMNVEDRLPENWTDDPAEKLYPYKNWTLQDLNKVLGAFALLPAGDRVALNGVYLLRIDEFPKKIDEEDETTKALFTSPTAKGSSKPAGLVISNSTFEEDKTPKRQARAAKKGILPKSYRTILHEVGHAVAAKAFREANATLSKARVKEKEVDEKETKDYSLYEDKRDARNRDTIAYTQYLNAGRNLTNLRKEQTSIREDVKQKRIDVDKTMIPKETSDAIRSDLKVKEAAMDAFDAKKKPADAKGISDYAKAVESTKNAIGKLANAIDKVTEDEATQLQLGALVNAVRKWIKSRNIQRSNIEGQFEKYRQGTYNAFGPEKELQSYENVENTQNAWFETAETYVNSLTRTRRVQTFLEFVKFNDIKPFDPEIAFATKWAIKNWPKEPGEFFADAYSFWVRNRTPEQRSKIKYNKVLVLLEWFDQGHYLK